MIGAYRSARVLQASADWLALFALALAIRQNVTALHRLARTIP